ncbi:MAG: STAS domain-containing protein [bacterium]
MEIAAEKLDWATLVRISGDVDMSTSSRVREALLELTGEKRSPIVVDLEGVSYMDSSGIATLVEGLQASMEYGGTFRLAALSPKVKLVFDLARLRDVFEIFPDVAGAKEGI